MLQWGHAFVSVETRLSALDSEAEGRASMGPRFCKRGNGQWRIVRANDKDASMGPRFCKRGNRCTSAVRMTASSKLQWGHAFVSVETRRPHRAQWRARTASMGPRFCKRGNHSQNEKDWDG